VTRGKKLFEALSQHLETGEAIQHVVDGTYEINPSGRDAVLHGLVVATDRRILFFSLTAYGRHELESFWYPSITGFEQSKALMGGTVSVTTADVRATVKLIPPGATFDRFCRWVHSQVTATVRAAT
jgi:hypothetical protein